MHENEVKVLVTQLCPTLHDPHGVGKHSLFWEIFPTQGSNLGLQHCRQILYCLRHQGNPIYMYMHTYIWISIYMV